MFYLLVGLVPYYRVCYLLWVFSDRAQRRRICFKRWKTNKTGLSSTYETRLIFIKTRMETFRKFEYSRKEGQSKGKKSPKIATKILRGEFRYHRYRNPSTASIWKNKNKKVKSTWKNSRQYKHREVQASHPPSQAGPRSYYKNGNEQEKKTKHTSVGIGRSRRTFRQECTVYKRYLLDGRVLCCPIGCPFLFCFDRGFFITAVAWLFPFDMECGKPDELLWWKSSIKTRISFVAQHF